MNLSNVEIVYKDINHEYLNQVYSIHKQKLGTGYLDLKHFENLAEKEWLLIALNNDEVLGYLSIEHTTEKEFFKGKKIIHQQNEAPVLVVNTCAVKYENCGIGTMLMDFAITNFSNNAEKIFCPAWKHGDKTNAHKLLSKFGFVKLIELKNFWYEDSLNIEKFCPVCNTPCTCSLIIYYTMC